MILDNGVIRTLDPALPTARALAVAGDRIAGGVGTHETSLATPDVVDLGGRCVLPGFTDAHVHFATWAVAQSEVRLEGTRTIDEALARVRDALPGVARGGWLRGRGWRSADWSPGVEPTKEALDAIAPDVPVALMARDSHSVWLNSAALARANGDLQVPGGVVEVDERGEPTGVLREESCWTFRDRYIEVARRRVRRGDAARDEARELARRRRRPRQGRLARRASLLAAARGARRLDAARLAVAPAREGRRARVGRRALGARRRLPAARLPEGVHGRDARLADRADARRHRRPDHVARRARGDHPPRRPCRLSGRRARDRRPREPGGARRVRGDAARLAAARTATSDRARAAAHARGRPALRPDRGRGLRAVQPRDLRPRPRRALLERATPDARTRGARSGTRARCS